MTDQVNSLTVPLPRRRLDGCACHSPLAHFHIHHTESSIREIHPFTTITYLASEKVALPSHTSEKLLAWNNQTILIQFLFRKSENSSFSTTREGQPRQGKLSKQWTNKLASLVEEKSVSVRPSSPEAADSENQLQRLFRPTYHTTLRLEGPYFTPANPASYETVICLVAGTGISGAIAIAAAYSATSTKHTETTTSAEHTWKRCVIVWSVREVDFIDLPFIQKTTPGLEVRPHLTGNGRQRLDAKEAITNVSENRPSESTWVYISGPNPFIEAGEKVCRELGVAYFGARWS